MVQEKVRVNVLTNRVITRDGIESILRSKEYQILRLLLKHAPHCVSRRDISAQVWSGTYSADATINQTIKSIRQKLGDYDFTLIQTVPRVGYQIEHPEMFVLEDIESDNTLPKMLKKTIVERTIVSSPTTENVPAKLVINDKNNKEVTLPTNNSNRCTGARYKLFISIFFTLLFCFDIACHIWGACLFHQKDEKEIKFNYNTPTIVNIPVSKDGIIQGVGNNADNGSLVCSYSRNENQYIVLDCLSQNRSKSVNSDPTEMNEIMRN